MTVSTTAGGARPPKSIITFQKCKDTPTSMEARTRKMPLMPGSRAHEQSPGFTVPNAQLTKNIPPATDDYGKGKSK